ncbi:hypothetical protein NM688_g689 [Phlebia brevispora]|uniref:Uncharacterized protein n=1 Tax=Phlebia brevispora TaxID=194682 RepID=A0ACC1TDA6_9APHY|nr:hypothetical protein NM688_g689 [Phlebia brevispora]
MLTEHHSSSYARIYDSKPDPGYCPGRWSTPHVQEPRQSRTDQACLCSDREFMNAVMRCLRDSCTLEPNAVLTTQQRECAAISLAISTTSTPLESSSSDFVASSARSVASSMISSIESSASSVASAASAATGSLSAAGLVLLDARLPTAPHYVNMYDMVDDFLSPGTRYDRLRDDGPPALCQFADTYTSRYPRPCYGDTNTALTFTGGTSAGTTSRSGALPAA